MIEKSLFNVILHLVLLPTEQSRSRCTTGTEMAGNYYLNYYYVVVFCVVELPLKPYNLQPVNTYRNTSLRQTLCGSTPLLFVTQK